MDGGDENRPQLLEYQGGPGGGEGIGEWVTVGAREAANPGVCCVCLRRTDAVFWYCPGRGVRLPIPQCAACQVRMKRWRLQLGVIGMAVGAAVVAAYWQFVRRASIDPVGVMFGVVFGFAGGVMMDLMWWQPVQFRRVGSATVDVRFRNGAFTKLYREAIAGAGTR